MTDAEVRTLREGRGPSFRCTCGTTFYALHNPVCPRHPIPTDGTPCPCCGVGIDSLSKADQRKLRALLTQPSATVRGEQ
jgi:hypothetical protein